MIRMIRGRFLRTGDEMGDIFALRERVFVEELGLLDSAVRDEADEMAVYALVFDEAEQAKAAGRLAIEDDRLSIGAVCVCPDARGQKLGDLVMRMLLVRVVEMEVPGVYVKTLPGALAFFQRYGFRICEDAAQTHGAALQVLYASLEQIDIEGDCHRAGAERDACGDCAACGKPCHPR